MINTNSYFEKGLAILPVKGKAPFVDDWYNVDFSEWEGEWKGIGLKTGKASGIICLDFDSIDENVKQKIKNILPPIYCGKIGNPKKLPTMFFRFNNEASRDLKNIEVQLLSTGKQTVLPPSPHPTLLGRKFLWCANSLLDIDLDDLPDLDQDLWQALVDLNDSIQVNRKEINHSFGRNNTLKAQATAAILNGKTIEETIDEIMLYDKTNHIPPLFEDKTEATMRGEPYVNALGFVCRIVSSLTKQPNIKLERPQPLVLSFLDSSTPITSQPTPPELVENKRKFLKLPRLVGLGDAIFHELYDGAPIPRTQFAFQNTMFLLSLLIGNKFTLRGTGCNLYTYSVGPSASGKDYPFKRTQQIIKACELDHLIGPSSATSETSILKFLEENREKGCWWNEGEKILKSMSNPHTNYGALECVTDIYDGIGRPYFNKGTINSSGELKKFGDIFSPCLCITMASTLEAFQANAKASMFATGLFNRFDIFFEDRHKKVVYKENFNPELNQNLIRTIKNLTKDRPLVDDAKVIFKIPNLVETENAKKVNRQIFELVANSKSPDSRFDGLLSRKLLRATKYAAIHHFMIYQQDAVKTPIDTCSIEWGFDCAHVIMNNMMQMLPDEVSENQTERNYNSIMSKARKLQEKGLPITKSSLANGLGSIPVNERNNIIKDMVDRKILILKPDKTFQFNA